MREQLLGYLLGALDADEQKAVEQRLKQDPELAEELARLQKCLDPLGDDPCEDESIELCPDLAARTFGYVMARVGPSPGHFASASHWRPQDIAIGGAIVLLIALIVFPAISSSRYQARILRCQNNLLHMGHALLQYSAVHGQYFPEVPTSGNLAAAGIYAPRLVEAGLLDPRHLTCPASKTASSTTFRVPTVAELQKAEGAELRELQRTMGGSYGYGLGYVVDGRYHRLRNLGRSTFALMADAPSASHVSQFSASHGETAQNVLFEDGHVVLLKTYQVGGVGDHIFKNDLGHVAPGIGAQDAVIVSSETAPTALPLKLKE